MIFACYDKVVIDSQPILPSFAKTRHKWEFDAQNGTFKRDNKLLAMVG